MYIGINASNKLLPGKATKIVANEKHKDSNEYVLVLVGEVLQIQLADHDLHIVLRLTIVLQVK